MVFVSRQLIPAFVGERSTSKNIFSLIGEGVSFVRKNRLMRSIYIGILGAFGAGGLVAGVAQRTSPRSVPGNAGYGILFGSVFTGLALGMLIGPKVLPTVPRRMIFTPAIGARRRLADRDGACCRTSCGAVITASIMGVFAGIAWINGFTMIGHEVSDQLRGRVFAFVMSSVRIVLLLTIAAGPVLAGALGSYPVMVGDFSFDDRRPGDRAAVGGLIAFGGERCSRAGRSAGSRPGWPVGMFGRRRLNIWDEPDDHAGVLIAVEGADAAAVAEYAGRHRGARPRGRLGDPAVHPPRPPGGPPAPATTDRRRAARRRPTLADLTSEPDRPALEAGAVVICEGSSTRRSCAYRTLGLEEERLRRVAAVGGSGLKADLTVVVDGDGVVRGPPRRPVGRQRARGSGPGLRGPTFPGRRPPMGVRDPVRYVVAAPSPEPVPRGRLRAPGPLPPERSTPTRTSRSNRLRRTGIGRPTRPSGTSMVRPLCEEQRRDQSPR